jgi:hypothetical protein
VSLCRKIAAHRGGLDYVATEGITRDAETLAILAELEEIAPEESSGAQAELPLRVSVPETADGEWVFVVEAQNTALGRSQVVGRLAITPVLTNPVDPPAEVALDEHAVTVELVPATADAGSVEETLDLAMAGMPGPFATPAVEVEDGFAGWSLLAWWAVYCWCSGDDSVHVDPRLAVTSHRLSSGVPASKVEPSPALLELIAPGRVRRPCGRCRPTDSGCRDCAHPFDSRQAGPIGAGSFSLGRCCACFIRT